MKNQNYQKYFWLFFVIVALIAVGAKLIFFSASAQPGMLFAKVSIGDLEESVVASGTLEAFKQVSVGAQVSGQIKSLKVVLGQQVKKGDLIAEIDSVPQENTLRNAQAALESVRAQRLSKQVTLKQAQLAFNRQKIMLAKDATSKETYETAEATLNSTLANIADLTAQIEEAKIAVNTAQVNLGYTKITAPINGTVVAIIYQEGQTVNSVQQAPTIIKLAQLSAMTIKAQVSEADVPRVKPGQQVYFTIIGEPEHRYYATLRAIEPAPDSIETDTTTTTSSSSTSTGSSSSAIYYNGLFDVPNPDGKLRISMTAQVVIVLNEAKSVLSIPRTSLGEMDKDGTYTVRVLDVRGRVTPQKIHVGINNGINVEVKDGLIAGQQVVIGEATTTSQTPHLPAPPMGF